jgi:hypothetical protein
MNAAEAACKVIFAVGFSLGVRLIEETDSLLSVNMRQPARSRNAAITMIFIGIFLGP